MYEECWWPYLVPSLLCTAKRKKKKETNIVRNTIFFIFFFSIFSTFSDLSTSRRQTVCSIFIEYRKEAKKKKNGFDVYELIFINVSNFVQATQFLYNTKKNRFSFHDTQTHLWQDARQFIFLFYSFFLSFFFYSVSLSLVLSLTWILLVYRTHKKKFM